MTDLSERRMTSNEAGIVGTATSVGDCRWDFVGDDRMGEV